MRRLEIAIPTIELWGVLLVPLQGEVTDELAERISEDVLGRIHRHGARGLVIDVTGLWMMDSYLCATLARLATAAQLMGTRTVLCGLGPEIALTLQTMGLDMPGTTSTLSLEGALQSFGIQPQLAPDEGTMENLPDREPGEPAMDDEG